MRNSSTSWLNHRCLGGAGRAGSSAFLATHNLRTFQRGAGALGSASPYPTRGWDFHPAPVGASCDTRPSLAKLFRCPTGAGRGGQSAAPCGHFASLVRSTFGLRGFPPLRFGASRWWWARGGDAEAFVRFCKEWTFLCCLGRGSFAAAGHRRTACQQQGARKIRLTQESQISNLKSHNGRGSRTPVGLAAY